MQDKFFGGFIITYNRVDILPKTIGKLSQQTIPLQYLLIVDNSDNDDTRNWYLQQKIPWLHYHQVGYNSGPAGAAATGLKILAELGYEWIYWGDDDDPPAYDDSFEIQLKYIHKKNVGVVGQVGARINRITGNLVRIKDKELIEDLIDVDFIGGGQSMIISKNLIPKCLPEPSLFFGFEELSFSLKVNASNSRMIVPVELFIRNRIKSGAYGKDRMIIPAGSNYKAHWREYYSTRAIIYIYLWEQKSFVMTFTQVCKAFIKALLSKQAQRRNYLIKAILHALSFKLGKVIETKPVNKNE